MTDIVYLRGLRVDAVIGVHPWERRLRQTLVFDLDLATNVSRAAASDSLADALDYDAIARGVRAEVAASECQLLETLASRVADALIAKFAIAWLRLRLDKPGAVPSTSAVGVMIERGRRPDQ